MDLLTISLMALNGTLQGAHQQWAKPSDFSGERKRMKKRCSRRVSDIIASATWLSQSVPLSQSPSPADGSRWHKYLNYCKVTWNIWSGSTNTTTKRRSIHLGLSTLLYKIGRLSLPWKAKLSIGWDDAMRAGFLDYLSSGNKPLWPQRISNAK